GLPAPSEAMHPGAVPAEQVVRCEAAEFAELPSRLLGNTVIVADLVAAPAVAKLGAGFRCVPLAGELLASGGTLTVGAHHAETGTLSRKRELRDLRERRGLLDARRAEIDQALADLKERLGRQDARIERAAGEADVLAEQAVDMRRRIAAHEDRRSNLS